MVTSSTYISGCSDSKHCERAADSITIDLIFFQIQDHDSKCTRGNLVTIGTSTLTEAYPALTPFLFVPKTISENYSASIESHKFAGGLI